MKEMRSVPGGKPARPSAEQSSGPKKVITWKGITVTGWILQVVVVISLMILILAIYILVYHGGHLPPKVVTEECPFCLLYAGDGLSLIDTQTGATDPVEIWLWGDNGPMEPGDWETQLRNGDHSTFSFMAVGGCEQTHMGGTLLTITPQEVNTTAYFCQEHAGLAIAPYVLVDRKNPDAYDVYPVQPGENFCFRHYSVSVEQDGEYYKIAIESNLFEEEVAQWRAEREGEKPA